MPGMRRWPIRALLTHVIWAQTVERKGVELSQTLKFLSVARSAQRLEARASCIIADDEEKRGISPERSSIEECIFVLNEGDAVPGKVVKTSNRI